MACKCNNVCPICKNIRISQTTTYASGVLTINLPANESYINCHKYCIVTAQNIPTDALADAPVVFTIGTGTIAYPFTNKDCSQVTVRQIRKRRKYPVILHTDAAGGGVFRSCVYICGRVDNAVESVNGTAPTA